jgi:hypothetical protein
MKYCREFIYILVCTGCLEACGQSLNSLNPSPGMAVGDILFDEKLDRKDNCICHSEEIFQYYSLTLKDSAFDNFIRKKVAKTQSARNESGYLTIRFIVNCEGKAGRFRILSINQEYRPQSFDRAFTEEVLNFIKEYGFCASEI